jgi:hypothetical protein
VGGAAAGDQQRQLLCVRRRRGWLSGGCVVVRCPISSGRQEQGVKVGHSRVVGADGCGDV